MLGFALPLAACGWGEEPAPEPAFVRGGVVVHEPADGARALPGDRWLLEQPWTPGQRVAGAIAPARAECVPLFSTDLGAVAARVARQGAAPDTALAFSPGGDLLAVGTYAGEVLVLDGWTGEVLARERLAESMIKQVAWSPDGTTLYAAEQSPDAHLSALRPGDLGRRWTVRLADHVGTSAPPPADDLYGVYTLPGAYGMQVLDDGSLLVAAVHAWNPAEGTRRNASLLLHLGPDGSERARWPDEAASVTLMHPRLGDGRVAVPVGRSATGDPPEGLPIGGVQVLSVEGLEPRQALRWEPLRPHYDEVFVWEALDVAGDILLAGLGDGRVFRHDLEAGTRASAALGTPILAGAAPVAAPIGHAALYGDQSIVLTGPSSIPWGAADPSLRPPAPHPDANALHVLGPDLDLAWTWRGPNALEGLTVRGDTLVVGAGKRRADERRDLFGALVFDLAGEGSGEQRLRAFCATEGPVFFRQAIAPDGRVAVVEVPWASADGEVAGDYRVTVLR